MKVLFVPGGNNFFFSLSYPGESESWWVIQVLMHPSHFFLSFAKTKKLRRWTHQWPGNKAYSRTQKLIFTILDVHFYAVIFCHTKYIYLRQARNKAACGTSHLKMTFLKTNETLKFYKLVFLAKLLLMLYCLTYSYILLS